MSCVKIKAFTGRRDEYLPGPLAPESSECREQKSDFSQVNQYCRNANNVPVAWKECWTDLKDKGYNRVVLFYNCHFSTLDEVGRDQDWQSMVAFMYDNQIVNLLLVGTHELLDWLWQYNHPSNFEYRLPLPKFGSEDQGKYIALPVQEYLQNQNVEIAILRLQDSVPVYGLNDQTQYSDDMEALLDAVGRRLHIPQCGTLRPGQLHFFSGNDDEFEPNTPVPMPFRRLGDYDFTKVDDYCKNQSRRPKIWHDLWTNLQFGLRLDDTLRDLNYNRVIFLEQGNFVSIYPDGNEGTWRSAAVFMHNDTLLDVLLIKTNECLIHLHKQHSPTCFAFADRSLRSMVFQPLEPYLNGSLTGTPVQRQLVDIGQSGLRSFRFIMNQAGINQLGRSLRKLLW